MKTIVRIIMTAAAVMLMTNFANAQWTGVDTQHLCEDGASFNKLYDATDIVTGSSLQWVLSGGGSFTTATNIAQVGIDWSGLAGTYTLTLTETHESGFCNESFVLTVIVHEKPEATFISATSTACSGDLGEVIANITSDSDWTLYYTIDGTPGSISRGVAETSYDFAPDPVSAEMVFVLTDISNEGCSTGTIAPTSTHTVTPVVLQPVITPL